MKKEQKSQVVDNIYEQIASKAHIYITDITGLNAERTSALRRICFRRDVKLVVVKNTLLKRALDKAGIDYSELYPVLKGTSGIMLSDINNAPAKIIKEFRGKTAIPAIKGAYVEECFYIGDAQLESLVNIKSKNELIGDIVGMLQSPIMNVMSALNSAPNTVAGLVKTLSERAE